MERTRFMMRRGGKNVTHVVVKITGEKAKEVAREIRATLRGTEYSREVSYHITIQS